MSLQVQITFTAPDPDVEPVTYADSVEQLNALVSGVVTTNFVPYVLGYATPAVEDQDKPWIRLNSLNNPVGTFTFTQGVWVREEPPVSARFGMFAGDPAPFFDDTGRGLKGPGPIALDYWGWALMNGNNGTQNWSNRFVIGGAMDNDGVIGFGSGGWVTNINGVEENSGGVAEVILDAENSYNAGITVGRYDVTDADVVDHGGGPLYGNAGGDHEIAIGDVNTDPATITIVPPFVAIAYIQFLGYT